MATVAKILEYPDPILLTKCHYTPLELYPPEEKKEYLQTLIATAKANGGIGLAANQIGWNNRVAVVFKTLAGAIKIGEPVILVNPIVLKTGKKILSTEGCLSLPGKSFTVDRYDTILVKYLDHNDKQQVKEFKGLLAKAVQHELDHLAGILIINKGYK
jgi:peptide deformylase